MLARWGLCFLLTVPLVAGAEKKEHKAGRGHIHPVYETHFKKLVAERNAKAVRERHLDRLLKLRYRTELYMEAFEAQIGKGIPLAEMPAYGNLLAIHPVRDAADEEGVYIYRRALETAWSGDESAEDQKVSLEMLGQIFDWIRERPEEDRLMISDWIDQVEEMSRETEQGAMKESPHGRKIASVMPTLNFGEYNFAHQENLSQMFKKHQEEIKKNAEASAKWKDRELDDTIASFKFTDGTPKREIASLQQVTKAISEAAVVPQAPAPAGVTPAPAPGAAPPATTQPKAAPQVPPPLANVPPAAGEHKPGGRVPMIYRPSVGRDGSFDGENMFAENFAFTFDDGPHPKNTDRVLDIATGYRDSINTHGVPLTFFWLEQNVPHYPQQVARVKSLGFIMNNHSWTHVDFSRLKPTDKIPPAVVEHHEVIEANAALKQQYGIQPVLKSDNFPYFRCPYGACIYGHKGAGVPEVRKMIADLGLIHILWNIDSTDWAHPKDPARTFRITIAQLERSENGRPPEIGHGVILMHDIKDRTPEAFRMVLDWIKQKNDHGAHITLVPVITAIGEANGTVARTMQ